MTAPYLGSTGVVRTPRRIICFKASCAARFMVTSVPYAWRNVCFVRPTTSGCFVRARPACVRLPALQGASALRKRAVGGIRYSTLLERSQPRHRVRDMYEHRAGFLDTRIAPCYKSLYPRDCGAAYAAPPGVAHRPQCCRLDKSITLYSPKKPMIAYSRSTISSAVPSSMS